MKIKVRHIVKGTMKSMGSMGLGVGVALVFNRITEVNNWQDAGMFTLNKYKENATATAVLASINLLANIALVAHEEDLEAI